jgi:hypothetical protein
MKVPGFLLVLLVPGLLHAQQVAHASMPPPAHQDFISGGLIRLHLESGGYTVTPSDSEKIVVTCRDRSEEEFSHVKVEIKRAATSADVYISDTPHNNFHATIEVPRRSDLWVRLSAGELVIENVEGNKNLELRAGRLQVNVPHSEEYGHRDASVLTGSIEASVFEVSKGGLFRSFEQSGPGKYRLHAHVMAGEIDFSGN